jgi:undecaprenyl-diphosphatase
LNWLFEGLSQIGRLGLVWLAIALVLALARRRLAIFVLILAADAAADLLATLGKDAIPRHRPFVHQIGPPATTHSFPSGHTATSFACASLLAWLAPRLRVPFLALAVLIAFSRLYDGDHYPSDVLGGAVLGVATALLLRGAVRRGSLRGLREG